METKKTAVDFLLSEISQILGIVHTDAFQNLLMVDAYNKAKVMEKEQIINAAHHGVDFENSPYKDAQEYYEKNYGSI